MAGSLLGVGGGGREFVLKIIADIRDAQKGMDQISTDSKSMKDKLISVGKSVAAGMAVGAIVAFGKSAVQAAADADDAMDSVNSVFGESSKIISDFAKDAAESMGLSETAYEQMVVKTGTALQDLGINQDDAARSTNELAQRAADFAIQAGTDTPTALNAFTNAIQGQTRGLKQFGINISNADIEARAMADGYVDASGKATKAGKAIAAQELIMEKTANTAGLWAENSGDLGNQQAILAAKMQNLKVTVGNQLLPVILKMMDTFQPILTFLSDQAKYLIPLAGIILGVVAATKAIGIAQTAWSVAQTAWSAATKIATGVQWLFNAAMTANPIGLIVAAIAGVVAGIVLLYTKVDWFRNFVDTAIDGIVAAWNWFLDVVKEVFNWVKNNWPLLLAIITGPIGIAVKVIVDHWETIKNAVLGVINWIKTNWPTILAVLTGPFGLAVLAIQRNWDTIKNAASTAVNAIKGFLSNMYDIISAPFKRGADLAKSFIDGIPGFIKNMVNSISNAMGSVADKIAAPFRNAIDGIKRLWNNTVGGFGFSVPSWVPGMGGRSFKIPRMAQGGIVTRPTIALIGEAGPEAVVPLSGGNNQGFGTTIINLNVYALTANAEVGRKVMEALAEYERVSGRRFSA